MDSIIQAVLQATLVNKLVLVLLLGMSVSSWAYMGAKWLTLRAAQRRASDGLAAFDAAERLEDALLVVGRDEQSPLYGITRRGLGEYDRIARTGDAVRLLSDNVRRSLHFGIAEEIALHAQPIESTHVARWIDPAHLHVGREDIKLDRTMVHVVIG